LAALICNVPFVLVVNPSLPVHSVADLVKLAKEQPLSYGSGGAGAFHHLMGELFKIAMGVPMTHVPYKGTLPALNDVIAGHIQLMFSDLAPAYPLIQAGKVRALGVTTAQRAPAAPELPPLAEVGVPGFDWAAWQSVAVPGDTPKDIIAKLNGAVNAAVAEPEVTKQLVGLQFIPVGKGSPEELARFMAPGDRALGHGPAKSRRSRIGVGRTSGPERRRAGAAGSNSPASPAWRPASIWRSRRPRTA
jgi:Uncharacterized protein conserved in bacteria